MKINNKQDFIRELDSNIRFVKAELMKDKVKQDNYLLGMYKDSLQKLQKGKQILLSKKLDYDFGNDPFLKQLLKIANGRY